MEVTAEEVADEHSPLLNGPQRSTTAAGLNENAEAPIPEELPTSKLVLVLLATWTGVFLAALDSTVISTLLTPISSSFQSFASIAWIATAYLIAQAALQPLFGKLTDIYGRRSGLLVSNCLFGVGTAMCGLAPNERVMVAGRVIAGAGGGGLTSISSIVASDLVPLRKRGLVQGGGNLAYGSGAGLGGLYGGLLADSLGWRWAFMLQIPPILLSSILVAIFVRIPVKETDEARHRRVDYAGAVTLVTFLVLFLLALNTGGNQLPWSHPLISASLGLSTVFLGAFVFVEMKLAREPIIPLEIMKHRTVAAVCVTFLFMVMAIYTAYFYIPIYSMLCGASSSSAGLRLAPYAVGISLGSLGIGFVMKRTGQYYYLGICAMTVFNLGIGLFSSFTLRTPVIPQILYLLMFGFGFGAELTVGLVGIIAAVPHELQATTTSASYLFRATGGTIGAAAGSAVFQNRLRVRLFALLGDSEAAQKVIARVTTDFGEIWKLDEKWKSRVIEAYMDSLHVVFGVTLAFGLIAFVAAALVKEHKLYTTLDRK